MSSKGEQGSTRVSEKFPQLLMYMKYKRYYNKNFDSLKQISDAATSHAIILKDFIFQVMKVVYVCWMKCLHKLHTSPAVISGQRVIIN